MLFVWLPDNRAFILCIPASVHGSTYGRVRKANAGTNNIYRIRLTISQTRDSTIFVIKL